MTGVGCLVQNTALVRDLQDLIEYLGYTRMAQNKSADVGSIYNDIRKAGIEIDLQTVGYLYNEALPKSFKQVMTDKEVNEYILKDYTDAIQRAAALQDTEGEQQIGKDAGEIHVVNGILNMFTKANVSDNRTKSDMLQLQNALWKGIQRKLKLPESNKPKTPTEWKDILNQALGYERLGITDLNGKLNGIADLYNAMQEQLQDAKSDMRNARDQNGRPLASAADLARFEEMIKQLEASSYSLLFSKGEAKKLLNEMMKAAGFGKELKDGKVVLDWNKLAGESGTIQELRANVQKVLEDNGYNADVIEGVKNSLENEFVNLQADILEHSQKELAKRDAAIGRQATTKSDLKRLAELNDLGIFESSHDRLLHNLIGVGDLQAEDIADLKQISQAASELYRHIDKNYGNDVFGSSALQTLQRSIDSIVARNIKNKSLLLKIVGGIKNFFEVYLTSLLMAPLTILENAYSGAKEVLAPLILGRRGLTTEDLSLYKNMLADVAKRGQSFGEEVGSFAPRELYSNTLKFKWENATPKEKAESLLHLIMLPARVGLLGFDSANKALITNKTFHNAVYQALVQKGMTPDAATKFMNEALHGQSYEDAKVKAQEILEKTNLQLADKFKIPVNNNTITRLANDLVKANLNTNGVIDNDIIEAALKSSYHVAGLGLGHEPNNILSKGIKQLRDSFTKEEHRLIAAKDWNGLAWQRLKNTFVNSIFLRFTGGATNWIILRFQSAGLGLLSGLFGKWNGDIDFKNKETVRASIKEIQRNRNKIGRAVTGLSLTAVSYLLGYLLVGGGGDDDKDKEARLAFLRSRKKLNNAQKEELKKLELDASIYKQIRSNYEGSRLFRKLAPDLMLLNYYRDTDGGTLNGVLDYVRNTTGVGSQYSVGSKISDAVDLAFKKDYDAAGGMLGSIAGDRFGTPLWRAYKEWYKLGDWIGGGNPQSDYKQPNSFAEGMWGGGMLEDMGVYQRNSKITVLPGIGMKSYEKFKARGIERMSDLKNHPAWWDMKAQNENGNMEYILDADDRKKAKEAAEKYEKQK